MIDQWDDNRDHQSHDSDKYMDEDMPLDQLIKEEKPTNLDPDMTRTLWMSTPSLWTLMRWLWKNEMTFTRKDFASNARNQASLENVLTMDREITEISTTETLIVPLPLLNETTIEDLSHETTTKGMYTTQSRNQDHERSTRWFKPLPPKNEMKCLI